MFKKIKEAFSRFKGKVIGIAGACTAAVATTVSVFAAEPDVAITSEMLEPILSGVAANVGVIVPVAIGLFVIVLGIGFIPKIFKKFSKG